MTRDRNTVLWWSGLRAVSVVNLVLWSAVAATHALATDMAVTQVVLSGIYAAVCAFRSFFPRVDLERTVMVDHWLSSIALGRTAATIAEMAFTLQVAGWMYHLAYVYGPPWVQTIAMGIVPLIAAAQVACWAGVLTLDHLWHAVEELLWTIMVSLCGLALISLWWRVDPSLKPALAAGAAVCLGSAYVMSGVDIPMYLTRREGGDRLGIAEGFSDAVTTRRPTGSWDVWRHEVTWMTPYFSAAVWLSIGMAWFAV